MKKMNNNRTVYFIPGDGIGPEVWNAAKPIIDSALKCENARPLDWVELMAGEKAYKETGSPLPQETLTILKNAAFAIKGPLTTPVGSGIRSLNVAIRQGLDLFACVRPVQHMPGLETPVKHPEKINMVIFRENTEDVYAGIEFAAQSPGAKKLAEFLREEMGAERVTDECAIGIKPMTKKGSQRLIRTAINYALANNCPNVTLVHKGNIMKYTEGAFRQWGYDLVQDEFADRCCLETENTEGRLVIKDRIADAMFQEALLWPEKYSVLATPNLNGDYLSDALAAQVGGLGLSPGVNMSDSLAFFEATHGTAPAIAGKDIANPGSMILCGAMLLEHMGEKKAAGRVRSALKKTILEGAVPADIASQMSNAKVAGCREFGDLIGKNL